MVNGKGLYGEEIAGKQGPPCSPIDAVVGKYGFTFRAAMKALGSIPDKVAAEVGLLAQSEAPPLTKHEVEVLSCGMMSDREAGFTGGDVLILTDSYQGNAMNLSMVYKTIANCVERGLVMEKSRVAKVEGRRSAQAYTLTEQGRLALRSAVLNFLILRDICQRPSGAVVEFPQQDRKRG